MSEVEYEDIYLSLNLTPRETLTLKTQIRSIANWLKALAHRHQELMAMDPRDWMTLTQYPQTSLSNYAVNQVMEPQGTRVTTSSTPGLQDDAVIAWDRGVKRSKDEYPVLKNEKDWDKFHRKLKLQAIYEGIGNQLNPD